MARFWLQDTSITHQVKGEICYMLLADEIQRRSRMEDLDPEAPLMAYFAGILADQQYHLALNQPSDFEKLSHYLAEGRYGYVAKRFVDRGYLVYLILLVIAFGSVLGYWISYRRGRLRAAREEASLPGE